MASAIVRSGLRTLLRGGQRVTPASKRTFSSSGHHGDAYEAQKWEKITYVGIAACTVLTIFNLSKGHPHHEDPPPYPYLHIRNKEFPWGPDGLFEVKKHHRSSKVNTLKFRNNDSWFYSCNFYGLVML